MDSSSGFRVQNTFPQTPASVAGTSDIHPKRTTDGANEGGNSVSNFQGCHFSCRSLPTTVHFNTLSCGERTRNRRVPPCDQPKGTKQISSEGEVQDGGAPYRSLSSTRGRLYDETRPQRRVLCSSDSPRVEQISSFVQPGFHSETEEMLSGTNSSLSLSGCGIRHNLHVSCPAGGTDQSDTGSMPGNARVSGRASWAA